MRSGVTRNADIPRTWQDEIHSKKPSRKPMIDFGEGPGTSAIAAQQTGEHRTLTCPSERWRLP